MNSIKCGFFVLIFLRKVIFMTMQKHFYLGANTPYGFFSYYDNIISQYEARKIYCIKGGPGTGKSSFMKKCAEKMIKEGYDVEFMHCSSDDDSLDGILIKGKNIALLDGTSPHITDPKNPGAVDTIINLGDFWDEEKIYKNKDNIISTNKKIGENFKRAYKYLKAAKAFYDDLEVIYQKSYDEYEREVFVKEIYDTYFANMPVCPIKGSERKLFATAITPSGFSQRLNTIFEGLNVKILKGYTGNILEKISDFAISRGFDVEKYYCIMEPYSKCEHLIIEELNLAFCTSNEFHGYDNGEVIEFNKKPYLENERLYDIKMYTEILNKTADTIKNSKKMHDELEKYYIPNMNFKKINALCDKTIKQILEMA